jgi:hypothetical protein
MEKLLPASAMGRAESSSLQRWWLAASATWRFAAIVSLIFLLLAGSILFFLSRSIPASTTYFARFELKFPGIATGRLPNGDPFSLNEIIEPAILGEVYDRFKLEQFGVKRDEFFNAFSIRPYAPEESQITSRFQDQLADRRLTLTEREKVEARLKSALDQASRAGAELSLTLRTNFGIPRDLGRTVVEAVPQAWSQYAIEKRGVLRLPKYTGADSAIAIDRLQGVSLPLKIVMLSEASDRMQARLIEGARIQGMQTIYEPESNLSFRDLENRFRDLQVFQINRLRGTLSAKSFPNSGTDDVKLLAEQRLTELRGENNYYSALANALNANTSQFVESLAALKGRAENRRGNVETAGAQAGGPTTIPQLSENFIDRLVEMSSKGKEADEAVQRRIADLSTRELDAAEKIARIKAELEKWENIKQNLLAASQLPVIADSEANELKAGLVAAATELNRQWQLLNKFESAFAADRLFHTGQLYGLFLSLNDSIRNDPFFNRSTLMLILAATWLLFLATWLIRALIWDHSYFKQPSDGANVRYG